MKVLGEFHTGDLFVDPHLGEVPQGCNGGRRSVGQDVVVARENVPGELGLLDHGHGRIHHGRGRTGHVEEVPELHHALYAVMISCGLDVQSEGIQDVPASLIHPPDLGTAEDVVVVDVRITDDQDLHASLLPTMARKSFARVSQSS